MMYYFIVDDFKIGPVIFECMSQSMRREVRADFARRLGLAWGEVELV
jgi:hypothetical protein